MSSAARKQQVDAPTPAVDGEAGVGNSAGTEYVTRGARSHRIARPHLRMVSPLRPERASRGVFAVVITSVLSIGMLAILLINTSLAQGAFTISELKSEQTVLVQQEEALAQVVAAVAAPEALEQRARDLGMVPSENPVFLDLTTGKVRGKPKPAPGTRSTMPRLLTPADATAAEGVDNGLAGLPAAAADQDPAAMDAAAAQAAKNEAKASAAKKAKNPNAENNLWEDATVLDVTRDLASGDAGLVAVPVP